MQNDVFYTYKYDKNCCLIEEKLPNLYPLKASDCQNEKCTYSYDIYEEVEKRPIDCIEQIELKQVSFKYSNGKKVLKDINLTITSVI